MKTLGSLKGYYKPAEDTSVAQDQVWYLTHQVSQEVGYLIAALTPLVAEQPTAEQLAKMNAYAIERLKAVETLMKAVQPHTDLLGSPFMRDILEDNRLYDTDEG
jgi:hypothetical protein